MDKLLFCVSQPQYELPITKWLNNNNNNNNNNKPGKSVKVCEDDVSRPQLEL